MLKIRVVTAAALLAVLLAALWWSATALLALMTLLFAVALAEWLLLARWPLRWVVACAAAIGIALLLLGLARPQPTLAAVAPAAAIATVLWAGIALTMVLYQDTVEHPLPPPATAIIALMLSVAAWLAMFHFLQQGAVVLLSVLLIVWIADTAAYFSGRAWGRRKLAPSISPGKTWAGAVGALVALLACAGLAWLLWPAAPLYTNRLFAAHGVAAVLLLALLLAVSIVGDLYESLVKRQAGVKDSSRLLPGHGGVLDRIDAVIALLPAAALFDPAGG